MQTIDANGARIPAIGLGTWQLSGRICARVVEQALRLGYRHIDTAQMYGNEREVGDGLRASGVRRDDVFVNTRYTVSDDHLPLIAAGIPVVDLIDWRPEVTDVYWHTQKDTPENCSAEALEAVGEVVLAVLREGI